MCDYFYNCSNFVFCWPGASRCCNPIFPGVYLIANSLDGEIMQCSEKEQKKPKKKQKKRTTSQTLWTSVSMLNLKVNDNKFRKTSNKYGWPGRFRSLRGFFCCWFICDFESADLPMANQWTNHVQNVAVPLNSIPVQVDVLWCVIESVIPACYFWDVTCHRHTVCL